MFEIRRSSKIAPPLKWNLTRKDFLGQEHWLRYKIFKKLLNQNELYSLYSYHVIDNPYHYWIQAHDHESFIIGTDDSGKLFTMFSVVNASFCNRAKKVDDSREAFRFQFFHYHYHWWEREAWVRHLYRNRGVLVRLQGDLVVRFEPLDFEYMSELLYYNDVKEYIVKRASPVVRLALNDVLPYDIVHDMNTNIPLWSDGFIRWLKDKMNADHPIYKEVHRLLEEWLSKRVSYRVIWGNGVHKHILEFQGFRVGGHTFLVQPGKLVVRHKEHGENVIEIGDRVFMLM